MVFVDSDLHEEMYADVYKLLLGNFGCKFLSKSGSFYVEEEYVMHIIDYNMRIFFEYDIYEEFKDEDYSRVLMIMSYADLKSVVCSKETKEIVMGFVDEENIASEVSEYAGTSVTLCTCGGRYHREKCPLWTACLCGDVIVCYKDE